MRFLGNVHPFSLLYETKCNGRTPLALGDSALVSGVRTSWSRTQTSPFPCWVTSPVAVCHHSFGLSFPRGRAGPALRQERQSEAWCTRPLRGTSPPGFEERPGKKPWPRWQDVLPRPVGIGSRHVHSSHSWFPQALSLPTEHWLRFPGSISHWGFPCPCGRSWAPESVRASSRQSPGAWAGLAPSLREGCPKPH